MKRLAKWILIGQITITIPDAKDQLVIDARNLYNIRTSQSLTTTQYIKEIARQAVVGELSRAAVLNAISVNEAAKQAALNSEQTNATTNLNGW